MAYWREVLEPRRRLNPALWLVAALAIPIVLAVFHAAAEERRNSDIQRRIDQLESELEESRSERRPQWTWITVP